MSRVHRSSATLTAFAMVLALASTGAHGFTNTGSFTASCHSFSVLEGKSTTATNAGLITVFSSYDGIIDGPPLVYRYEDRMVFSSEFQSGWGGDPGTYTADFAVLDVNSNIVEHGIVLLDLPPMDADSNGLADFLQLHSPGNANVTGSWLTLWPTPQASSLSGMLARDASNRLGRYSFSISNSLGSTTLTGAMRLHVLAGDATLSREEMRLCVTAEWTDLWGATTNETACCPRYYFGIDNIDVIRIYDLRFGDDQRGVEFSSTLRRSGTTYRGYGEFVGARETTWNDYSRWTIELVSSADTDGNGVPDFSDFVPGAPYIRGQPTDLATVEGASAFLHVDAGGSEPLAYQWYFNYVPLPGATNSILPLAPVTTNAAGSYYVTVRNTGGMVDSYAAAVRVWPRSLDAIEFESVSYSGPGGKINVDSDGNLIVGGSVKLAPNGERIWSQYANTTDFLVNSGGYVFRAGSVIGKDGDYDIFVERLDPGGNLVWSNYYAGPPGFNDRAVSVGADTNGNLYVGASSDPAIGEARYVLLHYDSLGTQQTARVSMPPCGNYGPTSLAVDPAGNAWLAGPRAVMRFDTAGNAVSFMTCTNENAAQVRLDRGGLPVIGVNFSSGGYAISKLNLVGQKVWEVRNSNGVTFADLTLDESNYVYAAASNGDIMKIDPDGHVVWTNNAIPFSSDGRLLVDLNGNVYWTGSVRTNTSTRDTDILTRKISSNGAELWSAVYAGPGSDSDWGISMAVDHETVYVGAALGRGTFFVLLKYVQPPSGPSVYPRKLAVRSGETAVFNCFFRGALPASYQWRVRGTNIPNATSATLILEDTAEHHAAEYSVTTTDPFGVQVTASAALTILPRRPTQFTFDSGWALSGESGAYWLEMSTNLTHWTKYVMLQHVSRTRTYIDAAWDRYPVTFYRAARRF